MGIRDTEISRLKKYAEGLGIKVYFKPYIRGMGIAEWDLDDQSITIYEKKSFSKTDYILTFLHELGHHLDWVYNNRKNDPEDVKAQELLCAGEIEGDRSDIPKKYRKRTYEMEKSGIYYMSIIYKELGLKIPYWKVKLQQDLDIYPYFILYKEGRFPTSKEDKEYRKKMTKIYKNKYGKI